MSHGKDYICNMYMQIKGKRRLKNGVLAGYVKQSDGTWRFRFIGGGKKKNKKIKRNQSRKNIKSKREVVFVAMVLQK